MRTRPWRPDAFRPWVESVAVHIGDPVARLRFLRVAAPVVPGRPEPHRARLRSRLFLSVLLSVVGLSATLLFLMLLYAAMRGGAAGIR